MVAKGIVEGDVMTRGLARSAVLFAIYASFSAPAHAYLDPATGSIIVQAVIGAIAAWLMYTRAFFARIRTLMHRIAGRHSKNDSE